MGENRGVLCRFKPKLLVGWSKLRGGKVGDTEPPKLTSDTQPSRSGSAVVWRWIGGNGTCEMWLARRGALDAGTGARSQILCGWNSWGKWGGRGYPALSGYRSGRQEDRPATSFRRGDRMSQTESG